MPCEQAPCVPHSERKSADLESEALTSGPRASQALPLSRPWSPVNTKEAVFGGLGQVLPGFLFPALAPSLESSLPPAVPGFPIGQAAQPGLSSRLELLWAKLAALGRAPGRRPLSLVTHSIPQQTHELSVVLHACNSARGKQRSGFPGQPWLHREIEASLSHLKPCPSQTKTKTRSWSDGRAGKVPVTESMRTGKVVVCVCNANTGGNSRDRWIPGGHCLVSLFE